MSDDQVKSQMNTPLIAKAMVGSLLAVIAYAAVNLDLNSLIIGMIIWLGYFVVAFAHDFGRSFALRHCPDCKAAGEGSRTSAFLLWPLYLIFTALYVPLVCLLRQWLRWIPD